MRDIWIALGLFIAHQTVRNCIHQSVHFRLFYNFRFASVYVVAIYPKHRVVRDIRIDERDAVVGFVFIIFFN